jgi:Tfp pilus assembly protein PilF
MMRRRAVLAVACAIVLGLLLARIRREDPEKAAAPLVREAAQVSSAREQPYRFNNIGVARLEQYDYPGAAAAFRRALEIDPQLRAAHLNLAIALLYDSQLDAADREARSAAEQMPSAPQPPYVAGLIARAAGRPAEAATWFRRVLAVDPDDVGSEVQLGQVLLGERRYAEATSLLEQAVKAEPFNATAAYTLATSLIRAGRRAEGQQAMSRFQRLREDPAAVTYSSTYLGQGRYAEALASTGLEPELVDPSIPPVRFADATAAILGTGDSAAGAAALTLPFGASVDPAEPTAALDRVARDLAASVTLADIDSDGDLDLIVPSRRTVLLRRNERGRFGTGAASQLRIEGTLPMAAVAGDYDNDGRPDLFVVGYPAHRLYHQEAGGTFQDVTRQTGIPPATGLARTAAFVDVDHDGDLDVFLGGLVGPAWRVRPAAGARFPEAFSPAANQLLRNNGNGRFADATAEARLAGSGAHAVAVVPTDYDNHRDVDLLVVPYGGSPALFSNLRDGTFRDVAPATGLPPSAQYTAVAAGDVNKDGAADFFFGRAGAAGVLVMSNGPGRFTVTAAPEGTRDGVAAQFVDYDNDGLLDLFVLTTTGARLWRNVGSAWIDVTARALPEDSSNAQDPPRALAIGDLDGDGDADAIIRLASGRIRAWRNEGGSRRASLHVRLTARVSNRSGIGANVELRAGSLRQEIETSSATPPVGPSDVLFGLGPRDRADVVRVMWPSGILQAETSLPAAAAGTSAPVRSIVELDRKPSSCPSLFTWNGSGFEFVTDFMGGGEMGSWVAPGERNVPDPDEYVRIGRERLRPRDGRYELRVTNELEEALFIDRLQLVGIAHPAGVDVYPNEGLRSPAERRPFTLYTTGGPHPPRRATDDRGRDVLDRLARIDRRYVDDFRLEPIQGYAEEHAVTLEIDAPRAASRVRLLLTGWTDYAFSSDNVAAYQAGLPFRPPALQVRDDSGQWQTVVPEIGLPVGRPQTVVVDLSEALRRHSSKRRGSSPVTEIRIVTTLRVYWDQILVDTSEPAPYSISRLDPLEARLRWRGFSTEIAPDGRPPFTYDYHRVLPVAPWKTMPGRYTREGDVAPLLVASDDRFVVSAPGDEVALAFAARALPPLPGGWTRTFLLYVDGFSKEMNLHSASPDRLEPLPFHRMSRYPYSPPEHYPRTPAHERYRSEYNTRMIGGPIPPLRD